MHLLRLKTYSWIIIIGLALSGITAFPLLTELRLLVELDCWPPFVHDWLTSVYQAISTTNQAYPYLSYGTDWLAFAHLMLAILFIGTLKDPVKNKWIIQFGLICCVLIVPLALIAGSIRQVPFFWRLIDCSFGALAGIPLYLCHSAIGKLEKMNHP